MGKNVLFVVNPIAGDLDKSVHVEAVRTEAERRNHNLIIYETTGENDLESVRKLYEQHNPDRVIIAGGDGTIKLVAEALEQHDVIIGILPAGSANGLSVDLDLPTAAEDNLQIIFSDRFIEIDLVCINDKISLHLSDLGLNAHLVKNYENGNTRGKLGYAMQAFNTFNSREEFGARIVTDEREIECNAHMIVVANSQKYGTGVTINPDSSMDDGKFEIVILKNFDVLILGTFLAGNIPSDPNDLEIISTHCASITTKVPVHFQIDGEYIGEESRLEVKILPQRLKIAIP